MIDVETPVVGALAQDSKTLQWGHVLIDVETGLEVHREIPRNLTALQWGHVLIDVETKPRP